MRRVRYEFTPRRKAALRRAQIAAATRRRYGYTKHDFSRYAAKAIRVVANKTTLSASSKAVNFVDFVNASKKRKR